jgi:hypothetical protein
VKTPQLGVHPRQRRGITVTVMDCTP